MMEITGCNQGLLTLRQMFKFCGHLKVPVKAPGCTDASKQHLHSLQQVIYRQSKLRLTKGLLVQNSMIRDDGQAFGSKLSEEHSYHLMSAGQGSFPFDADRETRCTQSSCFSFELQVQHRIFDTC